MAKKTTANPQQVQENKVCDREARSSQVAKGGIRTGSDFANLMSSLMSDVIEGKVSPQVANATVNAGGKLLKVVELQLKYGKPNIDGTRNRMQLIEKD